MPIYDERTLKSLPAYDPANWRIPLATLLGHRATPEHAAVAEFLERTYESLPPDRRGDVANRLRSLDDVQVVSQMMELFVFDYCNRFCIPPLFNEPINGLTPDITLDINGTRWIMDVATLCGDADLTLHERLLSALMDHIRPRLPENCLITAQFHELVPRRVSTDLIIQDLRAHAAGMVARGDTEGEITFSVDTHGLDVTFSLSLSEEYDCGLAGVVGPAMVVEPAQGIRGRIEEKVSRYRVYGPVLVALCQWASFGAAWDDVAEEMYGHIVGAIADGRYIGDRFIPDGFVMPPADPDADRQFEDLTGVLHCRLVWSTQPHLEVRYLPNPFATRALGLDVPTYNVSPQHDGSWRISWDNAGEGDYEIH